MMVNSVSWPKADRKNEPVFVPVRVEEEGEIL